MTYKVSEVISAFKTAFEAITPGAGLTDWRENTAAYDLLPNDPDAWEHRSFSIAAPQTDWRPDNESSPRQRSAGFVRTTIGVRWMHAIRGDATNADYRTALDAEAELVDAITTITGIPMRIALNSETRVFAADGSRLLGQLNLTVEHHMPVG
jgi:hypothetical protein